MAKPDIAALVAALPERYQPIFGHREYTAGASRPGDDRLTVASALVRVLTAKLGRPLRVLDLGCAQGYLSFNLAAAGAQVTGIDRSPENVALCEAVRDEHPELSIRFAQADAVDVLTAVGADEYDMVVAMSVLHHVCHERGAETVGRLLDALAQKVHVLLVETALRDEPVYWASALPSDPRALLGGFSFVHSVASHTTHLSNVERPIFFCSSRWWYLGGEFAPIDTWTQTSHEMAGDIHQGTRRYYFSGKTFAKYFLFRGLSRERNRGELAREVAFLESPAAGLPRVPALRMYGIDDESGWLVRDLIPGRRLSEYMAGGESFDRGQVLRDVLDELVVLENAGLYHSDVRVWNVILTEDGHSTLVDYGDISPEPLDCALPSSVFLSFLVFAHEVQQEGLPRVHPVRAPTFSPAHFGEPYRTWIDGLWRVPVEEWSFTHMRNLLQRAVAGEGMPSASGSPAATASPVALWAVAVEEHLEALANHQRHLAHAFDQDRAKLGAENLAEKQAHTLTARALAEERMAHAQSVRDVASLRLKLEASGEAMRAVEERLSETNQGLTEAQRRIEELERSNELARAEANRWWRATGELTEELKIVYGTLSWRVTAPLRIVRRWFPSLATGGTAKTDGPSGWRSLARSLYDRPRLRSWVGGRLHRFPALRRRVKSLALSVDAKVGGDQAHEAGVRSEGRIAKRVYADLSREIERRHNADGHLSR